MPAYPFVELVTNSNQSTDHSSHLTQLFERAERFDCYVAFMNSNGLERLWEPLEAGLKEGLQARFVIGLDFYQTEPDALYDLLELTESYPGQGELYISGGSSKVTFHPKAYVFQYTNESCRIIIGSANLTQGGLARNIETSFFYQHTSNELAAELETEFLKLKKAGEIETATTAAIDEYARRYRIYALHRRAADIRAKRACTQSRAPSTPPYLDDLAAILELMKDDKSDNGFTAQSRYRPVSRQDAQTLLGNIRDKTRLTEARFLQFYEGLVVRHAWHSGSLHRRRKTVAQSYQAFQAALKDLSRKLSPRTSASAAYETLLQRLRSAPHVGPNILTEILHTFDNTRFPVMNQNSVAGMTMAGFTDFPARPLKTTVTPKLYQKFCDNAELVRAGLGLKDFTELDALFNYAYW